jgi:hypothetical protein
MSLDQIVDLQIDVDASAPTRPSFGTPLLLCYHTAWPELVRSYTDPTGVAEDFDSDDPAYRMASVVFMQRPHPTSIKIGRRATPYTQIWKLSPLNDTVGFDYAFQVEGEDIEYTVIDADTLEDIRDALLAAINASHTAASVTSTNKGPYDLGTGDGTIIVDVDGSAETTTFLPGDFVVPGAATPAEICVAINDDAYCLAEVVGTRIKVTSLTTGVESSVQFDASGTFNAIIGFPTTIAYGTGAMTATASGDEALLCTAVEGYLPDINLQGMPATDLVFENMTEDPGIADDIDAIVDVDDAWYGITLDSCSDAETHAVAAWVEAAGMKLFVARTCDSDVLDAGSEEDIVSELHALAHARTLPMFSRNRLLDYRDTALMARCLAADPGTLTWAFKTLTGIAVDTLTATEYNTLQTKGATTYTSIGGRSITYESKTPADEFLDVPHFIDWQHVEIQYDVFDLLATNDKLPYDDDSVAMATSTIETALLRGVKRSGLRKDPSPVVTGPLVKDVPVGTRAARRLPDIAFTAELAGAIHQITIRGKVKA